MIRPDLRIVRNLRDLYPSDKKMIEGDWVEIRAIASGTVATREPSPKRSRPFGRVSTIARATDALASDRFLHGYIGFVVGCFFTVGAAYVWSFFL